MSQKILSVVFSLVGFAFVSNASAAHFANPKWYGYDLDWCRNFESACGQPAADLYCQKRGYPQSTAFQILPTVSVPTMTIGQNAICNPSVHRCDSFAYIDCQETVKVFNYPVYNGYRLDWCRQFEQECGQPAAQQFCQKAGYTQVVAFGIQNQLTVPTMTVGSNAICNPAYHRCDSFSYVECKK